MLIRRNGTVARPVTLLLAVLLASGFASAVRADAAAETAGVAAEAPAWPESTLSGDWGGARQRLFDAGVQVDLAYTADYLRNHSGGLQRGGAYMGNLNLAVQLDGEKLIGWQGGSAYLALISNSGGRFNLNKVGSFMGVDNLEAPVNRSGVFEAWLQQSFLDDRASLRAGLYPIDSEFYVTDSSASSSIRRSGWRPKPPTSAVSPAHRSMRPAAMAHVCASIPIPPGMRCWRSRAASRASASTRPART
jgi:porin